MVGSSVIQLMLIMNMEGAMMNAKLVMMIESYQEEKDFFGQVSENDILAAEKSLDLRFPGEYREFIREYGSGGICGVDIEGIQGDKGASVVGATERYRRLGLNQAVVVLQDMGESVMCMDTSDDDEKVYSWDRVRKQLQPRYPSFNEYLIDYFQEGIDNML